MPGKVVDGPGNACRTASVAAERLGRISDNSASAGATGAGAVDFWSFDASTGATGSKAAANCSNPIAPGLPPPSPGVIFATLSTGSTSPRNTGGGSGPSGNATPSAAAEATTNSNA